MAKQDLSSEDLKKDLGPFFQQPGIRLVLLFGSRASGKTRKGSDLDLAVLGDKPVDLVKVTNEVIKLLHLNEVDVVDLRRASPLLAMEIVRQGKVLFEKEPGIYPQACSLIFRRYVDTRKLREARKTAVHQFLSERGLL